MLAGDYCGYWRCLEGPLQTLEPNYKSKNTGTAGSEIKNLGILNWGAETGNLHDGTQWGWRVQNE